MTLFQKFKCFNFSEVIDIKLGYILKCKSGKCYQTYVWVKWIMHSYYGSVPFVLFILLFVNLMGFIENIVVTLLVTVFFASIILYLLEYLLFLVTPLKEVKCYWIDVYKLKKW